MNKVSVQFFQAVEIKILPVLWDFLCRYHSPVLMGRERGVTCTVPHFLFSFSRLQTDLTVNVTKQTSIRWVSRWRVNRAETRVFVTGAHYRERRRHETPEKFQVWRLRNAIFSTCHLICLRKIDLEPENGKQLQVTIIKITESKENNSIHRLDVSGSTGPGGQLPPLFPR